MELTFKQNEVIDQRYLIKKKIGEGGMSVVFQAKDKLKRKDVAVKFLKKGVTSSYVEDVIRFRREIEAVSKLDHPNIVKIYNSGEYKNTPFIVMELLIGDSLADLLDKAKEFGVKDSIQIISQLADALDYVHGKGILHRDLKPGNIMVSRTKNNINIKLLDFGVAFVMELGQIKGEEEVVGTFGYMSPEATGIVNKRIDERSDLYSLGVVFYRLLSGMLPFKGKEVSKLLHQQVAAIPSNLTRIRTGIAKELDEIVMKLLYKEQELRYQSTKGLLYDLKRYEKGERGFIIGEKDQKIKISYQTRLVGREGELHKIQKLYNQAKDANGMLCFISGESGVGKSRLVDEIRGYSYEAGGIFIGGRCLDQDNKIPYQPFRDAINAYIRFVEKLSPKQQEREIKRIKSILGDLGEIIIQLNANMGKLLGDVPPLVDLDPERENQRFIMVASRFFSNLGIDGRACILFLDDLQWADEGSLRMLAEIASNIKNKNLLILGTYRDDEVGEDHPLSKILKQMKNKNNPLDMIGLSPFSLDRLNNLIATLLGEEKEKAFSLTKYVFEKSSGNPFFAINIIRDMVEEKALVWKKGYWEEDWKKIEKLPVSISMIDIILKRIKDLPKDLNKLLCFGAVVGREFDIGLLYKLLPSLDQENIVGLVDQGGELQLLEKSLERGRILFVHDRIRDAFYNKIGIKERKALHLEIANALEQIYNKDPQSVIFDLVHHFSEGGDREKSLLYVLPAADKAKKNYANEEAIKYYKLGISLLEKSKKERSEEWMSAKDGLIDVYLTTGNSDEAITLSKEILPLKRKPLDKARIYRKLGQAWFKKGGYKQGEENLTKGLTLLGEIVPQTKPAIILSIIKGFILRGFSGIWMKIPAFGKAKVLSPEYFEIIRIYLPLGWMYIFTDILKCANTILMGANFVEYKMGRTKEFKNIKEHGLTVAGYAALYISIPMFKTAFKGFNKAFRIRKKMKDEWGIAQNLQWMGITYTWKGDHKKALDMLAQSDAMFRRIGDMWELGMVLTAIGRNNRYIADYKNAILAYNEYFDIGERTGNDHAVSEGQICLSYCYTEKGDFERAEHLIKKGKAVCEEHNNGFLICYAFLYYGFLELERENYLKAVSHFERARKVYEENAFLKDYTVYLYNYLTEAYIESYRIRFPKLNAQKRKEFLKKIRRSFRGLLRRTRPWINHYGSTLRVAGKYYSLMSQPGKARSSFKKSIQHHELSGRRYELAKSCFEYGNFLHSFGRESEARVNWQKAIDLFTEIEAKQYMKRTAKVLGITDKLSGDIEESMQERLKVERRMTTVLDTSRYLSSILDLDELLERIMDKTIEMVGAERGILFLYPEGTRGEKGNLAVKVVRNVDKNEIESAAFGTSLSIISRIEEEKKSLIIEDAGTDISLKEQASVVKFGLKSILCTPIMARGEMLGVIYLDNHLVTGLFKERDLWVLDLISNQAGVSIENALLYKRAVTDGLTGLYNRIFFDNYLINSVNEALRYKKNLSLIIIDIDHFKEFNDNYGHQTGDEVIKRVSSSLLKNVRTSDIAARYGGDEFVVILPETDTKGGKIAAEKIREAVLKNKIMFKKKGKEKELTITLSMGVASLARDDDRLGLISKADKALYISKEKGRNRVEVFKG